MTHREASSNGLIKLTQAESDNATYAGGIQQGRHNDKNISISKKIYIHPHHQVPLS